VSFLSQKVPEMAIDRHREWVRAVELWKSGGALTKFMEENFPLLRDSNGDPLPEIVGVFLRDLMWNKAPPRKGRALNKSDIREAFQMRMVMRKCDRAGSIDQETPLRGEKSDREAVLDELAELWKVSASTIDRIVSPRKKTGV